MTKAAAATTAETTATTSPTTEGGEAAAAAATGGGEAKPFFEGWSPDLLASKSITSAKTAEDVGRMYLNAEKRLGVPLERHLVLPDRPDDAEGWSAVHKALGRPETAADYKLNVGEKATDEDKAVAGAFGEKMFATGASTAQVQAAVDFWNESIGAKAKAEGEAMTDANAETETALKKEWGAAYDVKKGEVGKLINTIGGDALVEELMTSKLGANQNLIKFLGEIVDKVAEPGAPGEKGGDTRDPNVMTPSQAMAAAIQLENDPIEGAALLDKNHAMHKAVVAKRTRLLTLANGRPAPS